MTKTSEKIHGYQTRK